MNGYENTRSSGFKVRPRYLCCHANTQGTGTAARFELHPAHDFVEGSVFVSFASQKTVGSYAGGEMIPSTFDWDSGVTVRLSIDEVAEFLEVFRGYREKLGDGKGLFHSSSSGTAVITLEHRLEPSPGYLFGVSKKDVSGNLRKAFILLSMKESIVLSEALASSMLYMAFGIPEVIRRDGAKQGGVRADRGGDRGVGGEARGAGAAA